MFGDDVYDAVSQAEKELEKEAGELGIDPDLLSILHTGLELEEFVKRSRVGRYIVGRAHEVVQRAASVFMASNDIANDDELKRLHLEARAADMVLQWLNEGLDAARQAQENIETEQTDEQEI